MLLILCLVSYMSRGLKAFFQRRVQKNASASEHGPARISELSVLPGQDASVRRQRRQRGQWAASRGG